MSTEWGMEATQTWADIQPWRIPTQSPRPLTYADGLMECDGCGRLTPEHISYRFPKGPDDKYGDAYLCEECAQKRMGADFQHPISDGPLTTQSENWDRPGSQDYHRTSSPKDAERWGDG